MAGLAEAVAMESSDATISSQPPKRMKRSLTHEPEIKVYESNISETMKLFNDLRVRRKEDYERTFTIFAHDDHARARRTKVFEYFSKAITKGEFFQTKDVFAVSQEMLAVLDECREHLELLINWCDLCLPANEQAFAEAHRIKIQDFQDYLSSGLQSVLTSTTEINNQIERRGNTLRLLFSTKDVREVNLEGWEKMHYDLLVHTETNAYLHVAKTWEKVLEDYLLYFNYWKMNLKDSSMVFGNNGKSNGGDYFG